MLSKHAVRFRFSSKGSLRELVAGYLGYTMAGVGAVTVLEQEECCLLSIARTPWDAQVTGT